MLVVMALAVLLVAVVVLMEWALMLALILVGRVVLE